MPDAPVSRRWLNGVLSFLIFILAIGCGGGGGGLGNDPLPSLSGKALHITGTVTASGTILPSLQPALVGAVGVSGVEVFLESNASLRTTTDALGRFDLSPVSPGNHRVVVRFSTTTGSLYKARSGSVAVSDTAPDGVAGTLDLSAATARARGLVTDAQGNPLANAPLTLWGESFTTNLQGRFETPAMPMGTLGTLQIQPSGFQPLALDIPFDNTINPFVQTAVARTSETNRPPIVTLRTNSSSVSPGGSLFFTGSASDPDGQVLSLLWQATAGTLSLTADKLSATWTAPSQAGLATVTFEAIDPAGLKATFQLGIPVGGDANDRTPPQVLSVLPTAGAVGVSATTSVVVTFSEPMSPESLMGGNVTVTAAGGTVNGSFSYAGNTLTFQPPAPLTANLLHTVTIATGARDVAGNALAAPHTWTFTTGTSADAVSPTVAAVYPAASATQVALTSVIGVSFSEPIDPTSLTTAQFRIWDGGGYLTGSLSLSADQLVASFVPSVPMASGTVYTATVATGVRDLAGNGMTAPFTWSFSTGGASDTQPPTVASVLPAAGATGVPATSTIQAVFSEVMDAATLASGAMLVTTSGLPIDGTVSLGTDQKTLTFQPGGVLTAGTVYAVRITTLARDMAGNALAQDFTWSFTTLAPPDAIRPTMVAMDPAEYALHISIHTTIQVTFSEPMDPNSLTTGNLSLTAGGIGIPFQIAIASDQRQILLRPQSPLALNTIHTAVVRSGVRDLAGNSMNPGRTWVFMTAASGETQPPSVVAVSPVAGASSVPRTQTIQVTFSEPIETSSITGSTFQLRLGITPVAGAILASGATAIFQPEVPLTPASTYTVLVGTSVRDLAGNAMGTPFTSTFTSVFTSDLVPPTVLTVVPADRITGVATSTSIALTFSEPMDPSSISSLTFDLVTASFTSIAGTLTASGSQVTFTPLAPLGHLGTHYVWVAAQVLDLAGNQMDGDFFSQFTTAAEPDTAPPWVTGFTPANGATGVSATVTVHVAFSEALDPASLSSGCVQLLQGTVPVAGTITPGGSQVLFTPASPLAYGTTFTIAVNTLIRDLAGNALASPTQSSFTTLTAPDVTPPALLAVLPASGAVGVATTTLIGLTFSEPVDPLSLSSGSLRLTRGGIDVAVTIVASGTMATLTPTLALDPGASYSVPVGPGIRDLVGNAMTTGTTTTFSTLALPTDLVAPTVLSTLPANGAVGVAQDSGLQITFSESMDPATLDGNTIRLASGGTGIPGSLTVSFDRTVATFTPVQLLPLGSILTGTVNTGVRDLAGNPLAATLTWSFTTRVTDGVPPAVQTLTPADDATRVGLADGLGLLFNEPVTKGSGTIEIRLASGDVLFENLPVSDPRVTVAAAQVTVDPAGTFDRSRDYYVTISAGAFLDLTGNAFPGMAGRTTWNFRTVRDSKSITAFDFESLVPAMVGSINEGSGTISVKVPAGTNLADLVPTITHTGATVAPDSGVSQTFSPASPTTYLVSAEDGSTRSYQVSVRHMAEVSTGDAWLSVALGKLYQVAPFLQYSLNDGTSWTTCTDGTMDVPFSVGDRVWVRNANPPAGSSFLGQVNALTGPDLIAGSRIYIGSGSWTDVQDAGIGDRLKVRVYFQNIGTGSGYHADHRIRFYLSPDRAITASDTQIASLSYPYTCNLGENWGGTAEFLVPAVPTGTYYLGALIDADGHIPEMVEGNNHTLPGDAAELTITDGTATPAGAFKVVNSWGTGNGWENVADGHYWVTFDSAKALELPVEYFHSDLTTTYEPTVLAVMKLTHPARNECKIILGLGDPANPSMKKEFQSRFGDTLKSGAHPFPANPIAIDISEFALGINSQNLFLQVENLGATAGTVDSFSVEYYTDFDHPPFRQVIGTPGLFGATATLIITASTSGLLSPTELAQIVPAPRRTFGEPVFTEDRPTADELARDKAVIGVFEPGRNYNRLIRGRFGTGYQPPTQEAWESRVVLRHFDSGKPGATLPTSVDHSQTPWFPPIGNQGSKGSCTCFSFGYYIQTYTMARKHQWDLSGTLWADPDPSGLSDRGAPDRNLDRIFSPDFIYHQINEGADNGSSGNMAASLIIRLGGVPWADMPYNTSDLTSWPGEDAWRKAGRYRGREVGNHYWEYVSSGYFVVRTDAQVELLKSLLAAGYCVSTSIKAESPGLYELFDGNDVVSSAAEPMATDHKQTIVGYKEGSAWDIANPDN